MPGKIERIDIMHIGGLQKFSLSDYPGKSSAVIFTRGCNMRCPWCHNPSLVYPEQYAPLIPEEQVMSFLERRKSKLKAVTVSGGEPTNQIRLLAFLQKIKEMGFLVKLDTNGTRPEVIKEALKANIIDCFAVDYKAEFKNYPSLFSPNKPSIEVSNAVLAIESNIILALVDTRGYVRTTLTPGVDIDRMAMQLPIKVNPGSSKWVLQEYRKGGENISNFSG